LVKPVRAGALKVPTDRVHEPNEAELLLLGRTDTGVGVPVLPFIKPAPSPVPGAVPIGAITPGIEKVKSPGSAGAPQQAGLERDYGHVL